MKPKRTRNIRRSKFICELRNRKILTQLLLNAHRYRSLIDRAAAYAAVVGAANSCGWVWFGLPNCFSTIFFPLFHGWMGIMRRGRAPPRTLFFDIYPFCHSSNKAFVTCPSSHHANWWNAKIKSDVVAPELERFIMGSEVCLNNQPEPVCSSSFCVGGSDRRYTTNLLQYKLRDSSPRFNSHNGLGELHSEMAR